MQCQGYHMLWLVKSCGIKSAQDASPFIFNVFLDLWIVLLGRHINSPYSSSFILYYIKVNAMVISVIKSCYVFFIIVKTQQQQQQNGRDKSIQTCCILLVTTKTF